ncbi:MAG: hypothetical protein JM58_08350 [Peptococcaceae bacterium BICA1-8]|nr:MAG: hypothetical protein JM58_08350 [Peptococcaceae bacterium BICA1-8]
MKNTSKHKKWVVIFTIVFTLMFTIPLFADSSNTINLETAKELAIEKSRTFKKIELATNKAKVYANQADKAHKDVLYNSYNILLYEYMILKDISDSGDHSVDGRIAQLEVQMNVLKGTDNSNTVANLSNSARDTENAYKDAVVAKNEFEMQLKYNIEQLYTEIIAQINNLSLLQKNYSLKSTQLHIARLKKDLGMVTNNDIDTIAVEVSELNTKMKDLKTTVNVLKMQLNSMLGREYTQPLNLVPFEIKLDGFVLSYNDLYSKLNENYKKIQQLERDIKNKNDDLYDDNIKDDVYKSDLIKLEIKEKELSLLDEKMIIETTTHDLLNKLASKQKSYQLAEISYNTAKQIYDWDKKKYELGMISKLQLDGSELAYIEAQNKWEIAGYSYFLVKHEIELAEQGILINSI